MGLEVANHISELVGTNPAGTDDRSTVDDHLRLIKSVLLTDLGTINAPITATPSELNLLSGKTGTIWTSDNDGPNSGLDADTVDTYQASALLDRANHTGTQTMSTISDAGALATLNTVGTAQIDNGAVTQVKVAASAIGQGQIKSTTGVVGGTIGPGSVVGYVLPGGTYGMYPQTRQTGSATYYYGASMGLYYYYTAGDWGVRGASTNTSYATNILLGNDHFSSNSQGVYALQRYIQASPPYDLGDGEIPLFIFAAIDNTTGAIEQTYIATEAPWHYNGPTDIRAQAYRNGKSYRKRRDMSAVPFTWAQAKGDPVKEAEYIAAFAAAPLVEEEITQDIKNADMPLIPHPFFGNDLTGKTVVMLDPVADITHQLFAMHSEYDDFDLASLLTDSKALKVDNIPLNRKGPPGVQVVNYKWR